MTSSNSIVILSNAIVLLNIFKAQKDFYRFPFFMHQDCHIFSPYLFRVKQLSHAIESLSNQSQSVGVRARNNMP